MQKEIPKQFSQFMKSNFNDTDLIDTEAEYDSSLSMEENRNIFLEKYRDYLKEKVKDKILMSEAKNSVELKKFEEEQEIVKQEKELIENWKNQPIDNIEIDNFKIPKAFIEMTCKGISYGTILIGSGGIGKSFLTINEVKKSGREFIYLNSFITPLELFKTLYRNNGKIIIFDDVQGIFSDIKSIALLKSALWEVDNKRIITMETSSAKKEEVPSMFEYTGNIIVLGNRLHISNVDLNAVQDRVNYYEINFSYQDVINIMNKIVEKDYKDLNLEQRKKALELIKNNTNVTTENLSLRMLIKAYQYIQYDESKAEELLKAIIRNDENLTLIKELMESGLKVNEQIGNFIEKTGKSRRTFFNKKNELVERLRK